MRKPRLPATVSRRALMPGGSDAAFRELIHDLIAYGHRLDACRDGFAGMAGVSGAQYEILMLASRADGLSVGEIAGRLHVSGAFVTIESGRLVAAGLLRKDADPQDGRRVLLRITAKARALLERIAPCQRRVNDLLFENLDARGFRDLAALARDLVQCGDRAVAALQAWRKP
jgi:MarR family transcriptional regulator, organic hydroperoxide resistance regulator